MALGGPIHLYDTCLFFAGSVVIRGVADSVNDIIDADVDRQVLRTKNRPLACHEISDGEALGFVAFQLSIASLLYAQLTTPAQSLAAFSLVPIAVYPYTKRCMRFPQVTLALTINLALPIGWCHATNYSLLTAPLSVLLLYSGFICWTLVYDTAYATMDVRNGDWNAGVHSTALHLPGRSLRPFLHLCTAVSAAFFIGAAYCSNAGITLFPFVMANQLIEHLNVRNLQPYQERSVQRFFRVSCLSTSLVVIGFVWASHRSKKQRNLQDKIGSN